MSIFPDIRKWLDLPSRLALLLGLGALTAAGGAGAAPNDQNSVRPTGVADHRDLFVWIEDDRVYLSDSGAAATELRLGDTAEAQRLRGLLLQHGATGPAAGIRLDRMIVAGGGGEGFHWVPPRQRPNTRAQGGATPGITAMPAQTGSTAQPPAEPSGAKPRDAGRN